MKTIFLRVISGVALAVIFSLTVAQVPVSGQEGQSPELSVAPAQGGKAGKLEGTWRVEVTLRNCQTGAPIRTIQALNTYLDGGSMLETGGSSPFRSPSHGIWQHVGGRNFTATFLFFRFNPDGTPAGTQKVTRNIEVGGDGNQFTATASVEIFDVNDNLIATGCATETARRFE
jgi:hypothetical protein